ncbi:hypothetical protein CKA32_005446 [Geitlerinema sp. FC II]|nr:hypothetical protein CKA32_005446 [Geitlerinema sp. FC II]
MLWALSKTGKATEEKARSLKAKDEKLENKYRSICKTWREKAFPDF